MYSYEIDENLKSQKYDVDSKTYLHICQSISQISQIKYNSFESSFKLWTNDNYYWKFEVSKTENKL